MSIPKFIDAAGVKLPITDGWGGLQLDHAAPFAPLALVVNEWIRGTFPDLLERIERREEAWFPRGAAGPVGAEELTEERKAVWRQLTGDEVGDDPVLVTSMMTRPSLLLPRHAMIEILHAIARVRAQAAMRPRLPSGLSAADGMRPTPRRAELFTQTPTDQGPFEEERIALGDVEDLVVAVDEAQGSAKTDADRAPVSGLRRQLLGKLEFYGLLDEPRAPEKRAYLEGFRLPRLRGCVDAAMALRAYYRCPTRATYNLGPPRQRLLDGDVSLDWFRVPSPTPAGEAPERWLAFAEQLLRENPREGEAGEIFSSIAGHRYVIHWRRDYEKPAVVATSLR